MIFKTTETPLNKDQSEMETISSKDLMDFEGGMIVIASWSRRRWSARRSSVKAPEPFPIIGRVGGRGVGRVGIAPLPTP